MKLFDQRLQAEARHFHLWALILRVLLSDVISPGTCAGGKVAALKHIIMVRVRNLLMGMICALRTISTDFPDDRISTHPVESLFGFLRRLVRECDQFDDLLHGTARNIVMNESLHLIA
jgi:hypothetical protein